MKNTICFFFLILTLHSLSYSQTEERKKYTVWQLEATNEAKMIYAPANVRSAAGTKFPVIDSLHAGDTITVKSNSNKFLTLKNIVAPWIWIDYVKNGTKKQGYIWAGLLAIGYAIDDEATYLFGIDRIIEQKEKRTEYYTGNIFKTALKVIKKGALVAQKNRDIEDNESVSHVDLKLLGDPKLTNVKQVARIMTSGEACGIYTNYYYAGFTGNSFLDLPGKSTVSDAGVYWHIETILFPSEKGGKAGKLIKITEEGTADDEETDANTTKYKTSYKTETFVWTGSKAVKE